MDRMKSKSPSQTNRRSFLKHLGFHQTVSKMSIATMCICGRSISGYCNTSKDYCQMKLTLPMQKETTQPTIEAMDEVIARFRGFEKVRIGYYETITGSEWDETEWQVTNKEWVEKSGIESVGDYIVNLQTNEWHEWEDVKYHSSWDWLMPVVEKIETPELDPSGEKVIRTCADVIIYCKACTIGYEPDEESGDENEEASFHARGDTKIEAVHKAVYEFIQWYNQNKTNEQSNTAG